MRGRSAGRADRAASSRAAAPAPSCRPDWRVVLTGGHDWPAAPEREPRAFRPGSARPTRDGHRGSGPGQMDRECPDSASLAEFLRSARSRLAPQKAGLDGVGPGRRRVSGLRREELAGLAGVSVDYCTRLEQGRSRSASAEVLDALATALQLDDAGRGHLHTLAGPRPVRPRPQRVHRVTRDLLDTLQQAGRPGFVLGRRLDVLAHNELAGRLIADVQALLTAERNQARFVFLDPHARDCTGTGPASPPTPPPCSASTRAATRTTPP